MGHDHHDDHGHGHGHEAARLPFNGQAPPFQHIPLAQIGTVEHLENPQAFDNKVPFAQPRSLFQRFGEVMRLQIFMDPEMPTIGNTKARSYTSTWEWLTSSIVPLRPKNYVDAYSRPNPCPEEYWQLSWRWPRTKYVNAKVPPPVNGKYNDYYHFLAYKLWLERERDVYVAHTNLVHEATERCALKEGQYNGAKNCRHLYNKQFAMSRMEELNQALLYMAVTGNNAIRETPYQITFRKSGRCMMIGCSVLVCASLGHETFTPPVFSPISCVFGGFNQFFNCFGV